MTGKLIGDIFIRKFREIMMFIVEISMILWNRFWNLREYIKEVTENPDIETEILEVGDGLAISKYKKK